MVPSAAMFVEPRQRPKTDFSIALLEERSRLASSRILPGPDDQIEWADICISNGLGDPARLLFETAFIRLGFSSQLLAEQSRVSSRTGCWPQGLRAEASSPSGTHTVELAIVEMRTLASVASLRNSRRVAGQKSRDRTEPSAHAIRVSGKLSVEALPDQLEEVVHGLFSYLRASTDPADGAAVAGRLIDFLMEASQRVAGLDHRTFSTAPLPLLVNAIALLGIYDFLATNHDLISGPFGSPQLLRHSARLNSWGLGPYFSNVQRLARRSRDVFELADIAVNVAEQDGIEIEPQTWIALLSRCLSGPLLNEVIDDLGDMGAMSALSMIFDRAANVPHDQIDLPLILRLRDTALDNLDYDLASRAQSFVVGLNPDRTSERLILGTIDGSAGRTSAAEQSFMACLELAPENQDIAERLNAVRARRFAPFEIRRGFGIPEDRQIERLRRRERRSAQ